MANIIHFDIEVEDVSGFIENEPNIYSQAYQDIFAYAINGFKNNGTFIDIGCAMPRDCNNTFFLEQKGWNGLSFDIRDFSKLWNQHRVTKFIHCNGATTDYSKVFREYFKSNTIIDYLSFDVDQASNIILPLIPFNEYTFNVITIEHDLFTGVKEYKELQHEILKKNNYICLAENICVNNVLHARLPFEDWWVSENIYIKYKDILGKSKLIDGYAWEVLSFLRINYNRNYYF